MVDMLKGKKALLIGGFGFLGAHLCRGLLDAGAEVCVVDRGFKRGSAKERRVQDLLDRVDLITADAETISHYDERLTNADLVYNLVWMRSERPEDIERSWEVNCRLPLRLLERVRQSGRNPLVVHFGTRLEYAAQPSPVAEDGRLSPTTIYGTHKLTTERYHQHYHVVYGLRTVCLRISTIYGPGGEKDAGGGGLVQAMIKTLSGGGTFTITGDADRAKDLVYVDDVVEGVLACSTTSRCVGEVFNIGQGSAISLYDAACIAQKVIGKGEVAKNPSHKDHDFAFVANVSKMAAYTGWKPTIAFKEGMELTWRSVPEGRA